MQTITNIQSIAAQAGLIMMTFAATIGMFELPEHPNAKVTVNAQPTFVFATENSGAEQNAQRRERDESAPHYISYSASQRTPGRTGKV